MKKLKTLSEIRKIKKELKENEEGKQEIKEEGVDHKGKLVELKTEAKSANSNTSDPYGNNPGIDYGNGRFAYDPAQLTELPPNWAWLQDPIRGQIIPLKISGFSWTVAIFGAIALFLRGDILMGILALIAWWLFSITYAFFANNNRANALLAQGFVIIKQY